MPVEALPGIVIVSDVDVAAVTGTAILLSLTVLLAGVVLKLVPVMVTIVPCGPELGLKLVIVSAALVPVVDPDEALPPPPQPERANASADVAMNDRINWRRLI